MLIKANTEQGAKTKVFNADGSASDLMIIEYNTDTQVAKHYVRDDKTGMIKMSEWEHNSNGGGTRRPVIEETHLPGSYAEVDGQRVE